MALKFPGTYPGGVKVTIRSGESGTSFDTFRACATSTEAYRATFTRRRNATSGR